jgi:hypothetical protein
MVENTSPLSKYYRQPAVYITLPTKGKYYGPDVFTPTETGEIPILPMNAKDELAFKTPDAMISGQATVDVIKSCVPNFKNPWMMTNYDTDTILLAIRAATYGETMDVTYTVPGTTEQVTQSISVVQLLEGLKNVEIRDEFTTKDGFTVKVSPLNYKTLNRIQTAQYEQERIYSTVRNSTLTEQQKGEQFVKSFKLLNEINFDLLVEAITEIKTPDGTVVNDKSLISEFCNNCEAKLINEIQAELGKIRMQAQIPPVKMQSTEEQIKNGAPVSYEVPVTFDNSNFFV